MNYFYYFYMDTLINKNNLLITVWLNQGSKTMAVV